MLFVNKHKNDFLPKVTARESINLDSFGFNEIVLEPNDFILSENGVGSFEVTSGNNFVVGINTEITKELKDEGIVRDLVRHVQNLRKESGLNVEDRIEFGIQANEEVINALSENKDYFLNEVLGVNINFDSIENLINNLKINLDGEKAEIAISLYKGA